MTIESRRQAPSRSLRRRRVGDAGLHLLANARHGDRRRQLPQGADPVDTPVTGWDAVDALTINGLYIPGAAIALNAVSAQQPNVVASDHLGSAVARVNLCLPGPGDGFGFAVRRFVSSGTDFADPSPVFEGEM